MINQAIAAGLPIISTDQVGAARDLVDARNGAVIPAGNVTALKEALQSLLKKRGLWHQIAHYNTELAEKISPSGAAARVSHFLKELTAAR